MMILAQTVALIQTHPPVVKGVVLFLVRPNNYPFNLNSGHSIESVSGYVILEHGRKVLQSALLDHVLPQNIISLNHAKELGCTFDSDLSLK
jgi:hypothetical protein